MGDVHFEVLVRVCVSGIGVQCEGLPLARKGGGGDDVNEGMTASGLVWRQGMWWYGVLDNGGEYGGVVVRRYMCGGEGSGRMNSCRLCGDSGWVLGGYAVGGYGGRILLTFFFARLVH